MHLVGIYCVAVYILVKIDSPWWVWIGFAACAWIDHHSEAIRKMELEEMRARILRLENPRY